MVADSRVLETKDSAVKVLGNETLRETARELVATERRNASIDWTVKESVQAKMRVMVKRILRKHGYPPDKQEKATQTVLEQAELLGADWARNPTQETTQIANRRTGASGTPGTRPSAAAC